MNQPNNTDRSATVLQNRRKYLSAIRGSLLGGAVGDALGYAVEFLDLKRIRQHYGPGGIRAYEYSARTGKARVSDDTQMTLFTAVGLLNCQTANACSGQTGASTGYIHEAYRDWYMTQFCKDDFWAAAWSRTGRQPATWLYRVPQVHGSRAPGNTCLSALEQLRFGTPEDPINNSKGCGGVMRVAPVGLFHKGGQSRQQLMELGWEAARAAAVTHGHPLGYISAAALAVMVNRAAYGGCPYEDGLYGILRECMELLGEMFGQEPELSLQLRLLEQAAERSRNTLPDTENIAALGLGWVGEEALAIAVYCCLRHQDDFSEAVIAAVNHDGDSDSTGAVCGNLLGAWLGAEAIDPCWLDRLELADVIDEISQDLCDCCPADAAGMIDESWLRKYLRAERG